jgi:hypothetical protein
MPEAANSGSCPNLDLVTDPKSGSYCCLFMRHREREGGGGQRRQRAGGWKRRYNVAHLAAGGALNIRALSGGAGAGITSGGRVRIQSSFPHPDGPSLRIPGPSPIRQGATAPALAATPSKQARRETQAGTPAQRRRALI